MALHITDYRNGFQPGFTPITSFDDAKDNTGIGFGVLKLRSGERHEVLAETETAWLLMDGEVVVTIDGQTQAPLNRRSLFDESPSCVHVAAGTTVVFHSRTDVEFTVYQTANRKPFTPRVYRPSDVPNEHRGKGQVGDACYRFVRTIFDRTRADSNAELVLGEVVTMPGRWSSYPPHHHDQPEIYHYRFTEPQGYGHAELGETVLKVKQNDTVKIFAPNDHAQCSAPGYGMYYAWVIRHLPGNPYSTPTFAEAHAWTMKPDAQFWQPQE
ncbi:MAG TPA: 5-deoxy-glucuronate isomerase [Candidatus Competibacter phosphatis]|nr:5-deoxy-glucuronate isomerase [Candidatus Competibacter phosphatis]